MVIGKPLIFPWFPCHHSLDSVSLVNGFYLNLDGPVAFRFGVPPSGSGSLSQRLSRRTMYTTRHSFASNAPAPARRAEPRWIKSVAGL